MNKLIPLGLKGKSLDLEQSVTAYSEEEAKRIYDYAWICLQHPDKWYELSGNQGAKFVLRDSSAKTKTGPVRIDDYLQIDLPAPGPISGDGHDWVKVSMIDQDFDKGFDQTFGIVLKVTHNPENSGKEIAHFFGEGASSTLMISRKNTVITASYHGRNETANTENDDLIDKVRNTIVAIGAMAGISELQWKALLKGMLDLK